MMNLPRPAWIEVNLDNYRHNLEVIRREVADHTDLICIVKSDGYKFGAVELVRVAKDFGVKIFGVATGTEANSLRNHYKDIDILILGYTPEHLMEDSIKNDYTMAIYSLESAKLLNEKAGKLGKKAKINIVIDSGMNRIGFKPTEESVDIIEEIYKMDNISIEGMFTHFAVADEDIEFTKKQFANFTYVADKLKERDIKIKLHVSNSHATIRFREFDLDYVRPGIIQYGSTENDPYGENFDVKFIANIKAQIGHVKEVQAGEGVSYGLTYTTQGPTKIATIPLGYADGIPRVLSNKIDVLVDGKRCPQIGRICMDQFMVDVTEVDAKVGDEVVILGKQGDEEITIEEMAEIGGEIPTSFVTHFSRRIPRVYIENGEIIRVEDITSEL